jgi:nucleoside-diphosphate-sugar epimerase
MPDRPTAGILGASGFVGSRLVERLVLRDLATVRPITRSFKGHARLARFELDARIADATDQRALEPHLAGCDTVYHCVVGNHETIIKSIEATYRAAAATGVRRIVYLSSAVVHGHDPAPGTNDDSPLIVNQPFEYNVSKVLAERRLNALRRDGLVETVTLRPCIVFGPRSLFWTAQIATELLAGTAYLIDSGTGVCNTVYVDNLVDAMWLAGTRAKAANQSFLITDGERVSWHGLYASVASALGLDLRDVVTNVGADVPAKLARKHRQMGRLERIRAMKVAQVAKVLVSQRIKDAARMLVAEVPPLTGQAPAYRPKEPTVDREIASLQSCRYVLPIEKARRMLGYEPQGFAEAAARTSAWLRFAMGLTYGD